MQTGQADGGRMNVVIDTNVLVSAALSPTGNPAKIIALISGKKEIRVYYSMDILAEYKDVLSRPKLNISAETQIRILNAIIKTGIPIEPIAGTIPLVDEADRVFYDAAKESETILITGNAKHYPAEDFIMTPSRFLDRLC
jgi:putative PIN family toxin of toxin-antitoxin system